MKKLFVVVLILLFAISGVALAAESYFPAKNGTGTIGKSTRRWGTIYGTTIDGTTINSSGGTQTAPTITTPTITTPTMTYGYTSYAYTSGTGATYSVASTNAVPGVYRITGGSGTTTFVMSYTGTAASNAGRIFYIINSSSNTVTFRQSGATGINVATLKIMTVVGNGTDFERITANQ
jgi:hypothetical protein